MMRKGLMRRLTKSATDISGCTRNSHSTSPTEEEAARAFGTPRNLSDGDDENGCEAEEEGEEGEGEEDDVRPRKGRMMGELHKNCLSGWVGFAHL